MWAAKRLKSKPKLQPKHSKTLLVRWMVWMHEKFLSLRIEKIKNHGDGT